MNCMPLAIQKAHPGGTMSCDCHPSSASESRTRSILSINSFAKQKMQSREGKVTWCWPSKDPCIHNKSFIFATDKALSVYIQWLIFHLISNQFHVAYQSLSQSPMLVVSMRFLWFTWGWPYVDLSKSNIYMDLSVDKLFVSLLERSSYST